MRGWRKGADSIAELCFSYLGFNKAMSSAQTEIYIQILNPTTVPPITKYLRRNPQMTQLKCWVQSS